MSNELETLRGQNDTLAGCVNALSIARARMQQQRDQLLNASRPIVAIFPRVIPPHMIRNLSAATDNCDTSAETVADLRAVIENQLSRLDAALERAHDSSGYDTAIAVRDAARSLSGGLAATCMEADALVAEMDALAAAGGPLDDVDDPDAVQFPPY